MTSDNSLESAASGDATQQDDKTEADASTTSKPDDKTTADTSNADKLDENIQSDPSSDKGDKNKEPETLEEQIAKSIDEVTKVPAEDPPSEEQSDQDDDGDEKPPETESKEPKKTDEEGEPEKDETSKEEEKASDEWRDHPATKKILSERKKARAERDEANAKAEGLETEAGNYRQIKEYLEEGKVSDKDAASALQLARLWNENPQAMLQELGRMYNELGSQLGVILSADLQAEVDQGLISPERASELAKAKGQVTFANRQVETVTEQSQANDQKAEIAFRTELFQNWATQVANTDPDLTKKLPLIVAKMSHILAKEGDPGSPQAAYDRLTRAHKEVTAELKGFIPARKPTAPTPPSSGSKIGQTVAPQNYEEAMSQAIDRVMNTGGG